jgi:DNA-binding MarR family transcriptional regulator
LGRNFHPLEKTVPIYRPGVDIEGILHKLFVYKRDDRYVVKVVPAPLSVGQQVMVSLRRNTRAIDLHSRLLLQKHGLTSPQLAALRVIQRTQAMSARTLARELGLRQGTVSGILGRLEKRALTHRTRGTRDCRNVHLELTDAGARVVEEAPPCCIITNDRPFRPLRERSAGRRIP